MLPKVVVTGIGMITAIASDREGTWQGLLAGKSGIKYDQDWQMPLARVASLSPPTTTKSRAEYLLAKATIEAIADACLDLPQVNCGVVIGSSRSNQRELELLLDRSYHLDLQGKIIDFDQHWWSCQAAHLSAQIAQLVQTQAPVLAPMAACATSNWAIFQAAELIRTGKCDLAIAGATDIGITPLTIAGFQKIGVLASTHVSPFSQEREGFALGEGAAVLILESLASAQRRQLNYIYGQVLGCGITNDAHHATSPSSDNQMAKIAIKDCLERSQITADDVGYINVHGTATQMNDAREATLIQEIFSKNPKTRVSATKGATGHTLGATGMLEAAFCLLGLRDYQLPPSLGMQTSAFDLPMIRQTERSPDLEYALNFSFGFGGQNAIVAFGRYT